uniref:Putative nucleolar transcription factor 1 n=1 Tax=Ixodes ricinus TaxID=34613 RepID=A0A6B0UNA0_IXORI
MTASFGLVASWVAVTMHSSPFVSGLFLPSLQFFVHDRDKKPVQSSFGNTFFVQPSESGVEMIEFFGRIENASFSLLLLIACGIELHCRFPIVTIKTTSMASSNSIIVDGGRSSVRSSVQQ